MKQILFLVFFMATFSLVGLQIDYKSIYKNSASGVVLLFGVTGKVGSSGTGSIIKEDGTILTNAHVVINPSTHKPFDNLFVFLKPKRVNGKNANDLKHRYQAKVLTFDEKMDLAVVKIVNPPKNLNVIVVADSDDIFPGEATAAIGHPEQGSRWSLTTGTISSQIDDFNGIKGKHVFQMETAVNRGNSGGPLLDYRGYLIGINSMIARESKDGLAIVGINFSIRSNSAVEWMAKRGYYVSIAKADGSEAEMVATKTDNNRNKTSVSSNNTRVESNGNDVKIASNNNNRNNNDDVKLEIKVEDEQHQTEEISHKVKVVIKAKPSKKYKKRPKKVKVEAKFKPGKILTEKDVLKYRKKKAINRMNEKLGGWDDDSEPW